MPSFAKSFLDSHAVFNAQHAPLSLAGCLTAKVPLPKGHHRASWPAVAARDIRVSSSYSCNYDAGQVQSYAWVFRRLCSHVWHAMQLADFGLSRVLDTDRTHVSTQNYGTLAYQPAELLQEGRLTKAADVHSFSMIMFEMYSAQRLFDGCNTGQVGLWWLPRTPLPEEKENRIVQALPARLECDIGRVLIMLQGFPASLHPGMTVRRHWNEARCHAGFLQDPDGLPAEPAPRYARRLQERNDVLLEHRPPGSPRL